MAKVTVRKETGQLVVGFTYRGVRCREQTANIDTPAIRRRCAASALRADCGDVSAGVWLSQVSSWGSPGQEVSKIRRSKLRLSKRPAHLGYQMQHTTATLWLASGEAPEWIARQLGHSSTEVLFRVYSRYVPNLTRQDGSAIDRLLATRFATSNASPPNPNRPASSPEAQP